MIDVSESIQQREARHSSGAVVKRDLAIVRGEGAWLWDDRGRRYIDCMAGYGVANIGHAHPAVQQAIAAQAGRLISCHEAICNDRRTELLELLASVTPVGLDRFFLCNSGTEAVEAAIKFARAVTGRTEILAAQRGFHGRTMGALSATWEPHYREPFMPLVPDFAHVPFNNPAALGAAVTERTAAVILEVVQGEGGVRPAVPGYLPAAAALCRLRGALLIVDEIQTGFGRTGRMFAVEHEQVVPDMLCMAKSMAGGFPMGAVALGPRVRDLPPGTHGSTFGGSPLACAAAIAAIGVLRQEHLSERAAVAGERLTAGLCAIRSPRVREVRGLGLLIGVELREKVRPILAALQARGVLALQAGPTTLRLLPPLVITDAQIDAVVESLREVLAAQSPAEQPRG